uniref:Uncharacterized protein n=1 Tax=Gossypium raimondii TaxID=29730 RepID=A0A0D2R7Y6_GOSRA|nr:hypothetical protein B456_004G202700 [Gossypium raimondii]
MPLHPPSPALLLSRTQRRHSASLPLLEHGLRYLRFQDLSTEWTVIEHMGHYSTQPDKQDSYSPKQFSSL